MFISRSRMLVSLYMSLNAGACLFVYQLQTPRLAQSVWRGPSLCGARPCRSDFFCSSCVIASLNMSLAVNSACWNPWQSLEGRLRSLSAEMKALGTCLGTGPRLKCLQEWPPRGGGKYSSTSARASVNYLRSVDSKPNWQSLRERCWHDDLSSQKLRWSQ